MRIKVEKFDGRHYHLWSRAAKGCLIAEKVWPSIKETGTEEEEVMAMLVLQSLVERNVLAKFPRATTAKGLWEAMEAHYQDSSPAAICELQERLGTIKYGGDMNEYLATKGEIIASLLAVGHAMTETEQCLAVVRGLPLPEYQSFVQVFFARGVASWTCKELAASLRQIARTVNPVAKAAAARLAPATPPKPCPICGANHWASACPKIKCHGCGKVEHIVKRCPNKEASLFFSNNTTL
jgi:hypothetical protein